MRQKSDLSLIKRIWSIVKAILRDIVIGAVLFPFVIGIPLVATYCEEYIYGILIIVFLCWCTGRCSTSIYRLIKRLRR